LDRPVRQSAPNGSSISRPANRSPVVGISMVTAVAPSSSSGGPRILFSGIPSQGQPRDSPIAELHRKARIVAKAILGHRPYTVLRTGRIPNRATASDALARLTQVESREDRRRSYDPEFRPSTEFRSSRPRYRSFLARFLTASALSIMSFSFRLSTSACR
jgi:hypothetical protein